MLAIVKFGSGKLTHALVPGAEHKPMYALVRGDIVCNPSRGNVANLETSLDEVPSCKTCLNALYVVAERVWLDAIHALDATGTQAAREAEQEAHDAYSALCAALAVCETIGCETQTAGVLCQGHQAAAPESQAPAVKAAPAHTACGFRQGCASGRFAIHTLTEDLPVGTAGTHLCAYHSPYDAGTVADEPTGTTIPEPMIGGTGRPSVTVALQLLDPSFLREGDVINWEGPHSQWAADHEYTVAQVLPEWTDEQYPSIKGWRVVDTEGGYTYYRADSSVWVLRDSDTVPADGRFVVEASSDGGASWGQRPGGSQYDTGAKALMRLNGFRRLLPGVAFRVVDTVTGRTVQQSAPAQRSSRTDLIDGPVRFRARQGKRGRHGRSHR